MSLRYGLEAAIATIATLGGPLQPLARPRRTPGGKKPGDAVPGDILQGMFTPLRDRRGR